MAFKLVRCRGPHDLPLLEVTDDGVVERLSPGDIREADFYNQFRKVRRGDVELLFACPRGKTRDDECQVSMRVLRVTHPKSHKKKVLKECRSGKLAKKRESEIRKILKDVGVSGLSGNRQGMNPVVKFVLQVAASTIVSLLVIDLFFYDFWAGLSERKNR